MPNSELLQKFTAAMDAVGDKVATLTEVVQTNATKITTIEDRIKERSVSLPGVNDGKEQFSFCKAIWAIRSGDWQNAGFEKEVFDQTRTKALSQGTTTAGGFLVPAEIITEMVEMLRSKIVLNALGATVMDGLSGAPVEIPTQTGAATGFWVAENAAITASDQAFGQISMTPHGAAAMTKLSNRLLQLSNPAAEAIVRKDLVEVLARLIELAAIRGSGVGAEPTGIANTVGIGTVAIGVDGGPITLDLIYDLALQVEQADVDLTNPGFIMHPKLWNIIRKLKDTQNRNLLEPDAELAPMKGTLVGYPYATSTQIPTNLTKGVGTALTELYFGNFSDLVIGMWGGMELDATSQAGTAFESHQTWVKIFQDVDIAVRHAASFALINDAQSV